MDFNSNASRRVFNAGLAATITLGANPPAHANGDGAGAGASRNSSKPARIYQKVKTRYSQSEFARLTDNEIHAFSQQPKAVIEGFSGNMTIHIVDMAFWKRRRAQRLVRDMAKLNSKAARLQRLNEEKKYAEGAIVKLNASKERAEKLKKKSAAWEAQERIVDARKYLEGINVWIKFSHEGTRKS